MKTTEQALQEFLFKDKPTRQYCHKRTIAEWEKFVEDYVQYRIKEYFADITNQINIR